MRNISYLLLQAVLIVAIVEKVVGDEKEKVSTTAEPMRFNKAELIEALKNPQIVKKHVSCVTGTGQCDVTGSQIKASIPLILRGAGCPKCTAQEERQMKRLIAQFQRLYPDKWQQLIRKYGSSK